MPEIRQHRNNAPVILCGCQNDLRSDSQVISSLSDGGKSRFNTSSSKTSSNKLNISCDSTSAVAEFSSGQIAQPQHHIHELDDIFPISSSPVQKRRGPGSSQQRGLVSIPLSQRASFSANSSTSPQKKSTGLTRKTSFRSPVTVISPIQKTPTTVLTPEKSSSADSRLVGGSNPSGNGKLAKAYESLKSQGSTGSTGSKTSTNSSSSTGGALSQVQLLDLEENVPNTEDPELLNQLSFVSPKAGVYRPVNNANASVNSGKIKDKDKCMLM